MTISPPKKHIKKPRALSGRQIGLIIALALLALAAALYFFAGRQKTAIEAPVREDSSVTLYSVDESEINAVRIEKNGSVSLSLTRTENGLKLTGLENEPVLEDRLYDILYSVMSLTASDIGSDEPDGEWEEYGLGESGLKATVTLTDNREYSFIVGDYAIGTETRFLRLIGDNHVYLCNADLYSVIDETGSGNLYSVENISVSSTLADEIRLTGKGNETLLNLRLTGGADYLSVYFWEVVQAGYPAAIDRTGALLDTLSSARVTLFEDKLTDENAGRYGLDNPEYTLYVHQRAGKIESSEYVPNDEGYKVEYRTDEYAETSLTLEIGSLKNDYTRYCRVNKGENVYLLSSLLMGDLLSARDAQYLSQAPFYVSLDAVDEITVYEGANARNYAVNIVEKTDENGETVTDAAGKPQYEYEIRLGGAAHDEEAFLQAFAALSEARVTSAYSGEKPEAQSDYTVVYRFYNGLERRVELIPCDALHHAVYVNGVCLFKMVNTDFGL
ncbi:MAG: DUF4340 domain-containing protein [Eubacteriales bacterium]|nr:DUF4340 domain-containing protein [Eubacteriales bacterium]MDD3882273.1 DUF4340 domain-containing protein [Eubacteriales bacterium]